MIIKALIGASPCVSPNSRLQFRFIRVGLVPYSRMNVKLTAVGIRGVVVKLPPETRATAAVL